MSSSKRISKAFQTAKQLDFDDSSKIIIMSDAHKGDGNWDDDFANNQNLYFYALNHYYNENYTFIDLGDSEELWLNKNLKKIVNINSHIFWLLKKFYNESRIHFIYGNHDMVKMNKKWLKKNYNFYYDTSKNKISPLFEDVKVYSAIVLTHTYTKNKVLLIHGHQADFFNFVLWKFSRFLVRYLWRPLHMLGVNDPTGAAKNYKKMNIVEQKLIHWVKKEDQLLIAGHTHRPVFPDVNETPYFNDGCAIHPRCITGIEIISGEIMLIKWSVKTKADGTLYVGRDILAGPTKLIEYYKNY